LIRSSSVVCISKDASAAHRKHQLLPANTTRKKISHQFSTSVLARNAQANLMSAWNHPATCSSQRVWLGHCGGLSSSPTDSPRSFKIRTIPCETSSKSRFQVKIRDKTGVKTTSKGQVSSIINITNVLVRGPSTFTLATKAHAMPCFDMRCD
jgi:hypothetical protein